MRRAILALTGMVAGTTLLVSVKSAPGASRLPAQVAADAAAAAKAAALASASPGALLDGDGASPAPGGSGAPVQPAPGQTAGQPAPGQPAAGQPAPGSTTKAPPNPPKPTTKPPNPPATGGTFTGTSVYTEFGYVQVAITVSGGKFTVNTIEMPRNEPRSDTLSDRVEPELRQRALTAQSSKIDSVSGATYTSDGYKSSLQSAIDKAGLG